MGSLLQKLLRRGQSAQAERSISDDSSRAPQHPSRQARSPQYNSSSQYDRRIPHRSPHQSRDHFEGDSNLAQSSGPGVSPEPDARSDLDAPQLSGLSGGASTRQVTPAGSQVVLGGATAQQNEDEWEVYSTSDAMRYYEQIHGASTSKGDSADAPKSPVQEVDTWLEEELSTPMPSIQSSQGRHTLGRAVTPARASNQRAPLPETEVVSAISPPLMLTGDAPALSSAESYSATSGDRERRAKDYGSGEQRRSTPLPRISPTPTPALFQWSQSADRQHSISQALLPVAIPTLRSYAIAELHEIDYLRSHEASIERDQALWASYERYLSFYPNHMEMWGEFSEFMIEVRGLEKASERIKEALDLVLDETPLLIILTEMSFRMCDHVIASHYINRAVQLQPENYEVLTLLRDIQRENKLYDSASDTEALIQSLQHKPSRRNSSSSTSAQHELIT